MVEFVVVLLVKQKLELYPNASKVTDDGWKLERNFSEENGKSYHNNSTVEPMEEKMHDSKTMTERGLQNKRSETKQLGCFNTLPHTTKIDFVAFLVFIFSYFIFNSIYFIYVRQVLA